MYLSTFVKSLGKRFLTKLTFLNPKFSFIIVKRHAKTLVQKNMLYINLITDTNFDIFSDCKIIKLNISRPIYFFKICALFFEDLTCINMLEGFFFEKSFFNDLELFSWLENYLFWHQILRLILSSKSNYLILTQYSKHIHFRNFSSNNWKEMVILLFQISLLNRKRHFNTFL